MNPLSWLASATVALYRAITARAVVRGWELGIEDGKNVIAARIEADRKAALEEIEPEQIEDAPKNKKSK